MAALLVSCESEINYEYEDVEKPVYNAEILYGTPIESREDLEKIGVDEDYPLNGNYYLAQDIDLGEDPWTPLGPDADNPFTGFLNGNGKTISGLVLQDGEEGEDEESGELVYIGLFGYLSLARVSNLTLELANDFATPIELATGTQYIGALVGYTLNSVISDITVHAGAEKGLNITKTSGTSYVGGVIGYVYSSNNQIQNIEADLSLKLEAGGAAYGGGITAYSGTSTVRDCRVFGTVEVSNTAGALYAGGAVGQASAAVTNCASTVTKVSGETRGTGAVYVGGIVGNGVATNSTLAPPSGREILIQAKAGDTGTGITSAGGISGYTAGTTVFTNNSVKGPASIRAESAATRATYAGGITGLGTVAASYSQGVEVEVEAKGTTGTLNTRVAAGGIAGSTTNISNCFSDSKVTLKIALKTNTSNNAAIGAGGIAGVITQAGQVANSYAKGTVELVNTNAENTVFAGGLAGAGSYSTNAITLKNSVALNSSVTVESANTGENSVHLNRVLGGAFNQQGVIVPADDVPKTELTILEFNYASENMATQKKTTNSEWEPVNQEKNDSYGLTGDANLPDPLARNFFQSTLGWDFTTIWKWDNALNLPVLNSN
jgi:hypothetical protein